MGNKRKKGQRYSRFGIPGGKHAYKAKRHARVLKKLCEETLSCVKQENSFIIKKKDNLKITFAKMLVLKAKRFIIRKTHGLKFNITSVKCDTMHGNRIINIENLKSHVGEITKHSAICDKARQIAINGLDPVTLIAEKRDGLHCILRGKCNGCGKLFEVSNSGKIDSGKGMLSDINVRGVWGSMVTGGGWSTMHEFLGTLGVPIITQTKYTQMEAQIGEWWREVLQEDMLEAGREERQHAIDTNNFHEGVPAITVVCDGGWSKRSHKHTYNAMTGVAVIIGLHTKKLLHIGIRNKLCYVCSAAESKQQQPKDHVCFKNWYESSQAMESDIILEGFINCEKVHNVRYINIIADGDSSVYSSIVENVTGWGCYVKKMECANHSCKCLRSHLEQLVVDKPYYKGKGKLTLLNRKKIVQGVRSAIKMRSAEKDRTAATKKLKMDIKNCARHVLGYHNMCSTDFCRYKGKELKSKSSVPENADTNEDSEESDTLKEISDMWTDTVKDLTPAEFHDIRIGGKAECSIDEQLLSDVFLILNRMAEKSDGLICNFTSNLAESWMNIRCKFDGGKMNNRSFRGSFYARCYGGGLRSSRGPAWSPLVYSKVTGNRPDDVFIATYRQRSKQYLRTAKHQKDIKVKQNRTRKKMLATKSNVTKKAARSYGPKVLEDTSDVSPEELNLQCDTYLKQNICLSKDEIKTIEIETRGQSVNDRWKIERKKRLTSSVFGEVMNRNLTNNSNCLTKRLLYTNFEGNMFTRKGLLEEENSRQEYMNVMNKDRKIVSHISVPGLVISEDYPFLASSSDGIVHLMDGSEGLIEIKNLLQNKNYMIKDAAVNEKQFCLNFKSGKLSLKRQHKFFFQLQGQLNILGKKWCHLLIRRTNPYDVYIERINIDENLWNDVMVPKLKAFYLTHLLPEIVRPRHGTVSGIRKPEVPWYMCRKPPLRDPGESLSKQSTSTAVSSTETRTSSRISRRKKKVSW